MSGGFFQNPPDVQNIFKKMKLKLLLPALLFAFFGKTTTAQTPVEIFGGHKKTTLDVLFFKFFKKKDGSNSRFLFFNRSRTSLDYRMTKTTFLPQFGSTNALSFNLPKLKGFAPVLVAQFLNRGAYPKAGLQFFRRKNDLTFFSWTVVELLNKPNFDWFVLARFEPKLNEKWRIFTQIELFNAFPTDENLSKNFVQRGRFGLKNGPFQVGLGADFGQNGRSIFTINNNMGVFLRQEF
jgi:hypothetical protein